MVDELLLDAVYGGALVRPGIVDVALPGVVFDAENEVPPFEVRREYIVKREAHEVFGDILAAHGLRQIPRPALGGRVGNHEVPVGVMDARVTEEGGDVLLRELVLAVALGLDGPVAPVLGIVRDEVDTKVGLLSVVGRGVRPHPNLVYASRPRGVVLQIALDGALPARALLLGVHRVSKDKVVKFFGVHGASGGK